MTATRRPAGPSRGGQGGHEPGARIHARERRVQRKTQSATGAATATVVQLAVDTQYGDPRYLEVARKALADQRTLWGLDAPQKLDVRASQHPFAAMTDEALAAELVRQQQLLATLDAPAVAPASGDASTEVDDDDA